MYTTVDQVKKTTGYDVTLDEIARAQVIIEALTGKTEAEIENSRDKAMLGRATAFQAVYMKSNPEVAYEQMDIVNLSANNTNVTFRADMYSPFVAPLALIAVRRLSWRRSRSVKTGSMFSRPFKRAWESV